MYISEDVAPISGREHIARLYRLIARDIEDCDEGVPFLRKHASKINWNTILTPLHVASSIESLTADTSYVDDTHALYFCSAVVDFENTHSELMSQYMKELTVFAWVWLAFEKTVDALCAAVQRQSRTKRAITFISNTMGPGRLPGLKNIEQRALKLAPTGVRIQAIKTAKDEPGFLFIHLCREARNHFFHGDAAIPNPQDVEICTERESHVIFVRMLTQLVLFAIQIMFLVVFQDSGHQTATIMESRGVPKDILVKDALLVLHLDENDYDQRKSELDFSTT